MLTSHVCFAKWDSFHTVAGSKSYVFQGEFNGKTVRITIGSPDAWTIPQAQERARELQRLIDQGRDPRVVKAEAVAADTAAVADRMNSKDRFCRIIGSPFSRSPWHKVRKGLAQRGLP